MKLVLLTGQIWGVYMFFGPKLPVQRGTCVYCLALLTLVWLPTIVGAQPLPAKAAGPASAAPADFFVPGGSFKKLAADPKQATAAPGSSLTPQSAAVAPVVPAAAVTPKVLLYASTTTSAFFTTGGFDAKTNIRAWEVFLRKYRIPYQLISSVDQLEKSQAGVLLLPSTVAMSEREKQAVIDFRTKGGGVLSSWLTGVRNENGEWRGFDFMQRALDVKVVGNTAADENDIFMMPYGDNPVTHNLPAGLRIWLERVKDWYPIRLVGRHPAANIMDWSRSVVTDKPSTIISFDERTEYSGRLSRSVVLGYPERLWVSADPKRLEAIAHNALMWLLRQPDVYPSAWPHPYGSAFVMAVDVADLMVDKDLDFAAMLEDAGGRGSYYVLSATAEKSSATLKKLQGRGHEIAYLGDQYEGFRDQSSTVQAKRLDAMRKGMTESGLPIAPNAGFRVPMDSADKTTEKLVKERPFAYFVATLESSDARLPFFGTTDPDAMQAPGALVVLPPTPRGPEDFLDEGDPVVGLKAFLAEIDVAEQMGGLSFVGIPNQSLLTKEQLTEIFTYLKDRRQRIWLTTAGKVAAWWRERERVTARLESSAAGPLLTVTINGTGPLQQAVALWVNLPESAGSLRLVGGGVQARVPKIASVDAWRTAILLDGFTPGEYRWQLYFERSPALAGK